MHQEVKLKAFFKLSLLQGAALRGSARKMGQNVLGHSVAQRRFPVRPVRTRAVLQLHGTHGAAVLREKLFLDAYQERVGWPVAMAMGRGVAYKARALGGELCVGHGHKDERGTVDGKHQGVLQERVLLFQGIHPGVQLLDSGFESVCFSEEVLLSLARPYRGLSILEPSGLALV